MFVTVCGFRVIYYTRRVRFFFDAKGGFFRIFGGSLVFVFGGNEGVIGVIGVIVHGETKIYA